MPRVDANGLELEYDERGAGEPLLLVMGIGAQLIHWPDGFVDLLAPTLVAHGLADPLIPVAQGHATAAAIPGATWLEREGWGRDLPRALWPELTSAITRHARALGSAAA